MFVVGQHAIVAEDDGADDAEAIWFQDRADHGERTAALVVGCQAMQAATPDAAARLTEVVLDGLRSP